MRAGAGGRGQGRVDPRAVRGRAGGCAAGGQPLARGGAGGGSRGAPEAVYARTKTRCALLRPELGAPCCCRPRAFDQCLTGGGARADAVRSPSCGTVTATSAWRCRRARAMLRSGLPQCGSARQRQRGRRRRGACRGRARSSLSARCGPSTLRTKKAPAPPAAAGPSPYAFPCRGAAVVGRCAPQRAGGGGRGI